MRDHIWSEVEILFRDAEFEVLVGYICLYIDGKINLKSGRQNQTREIEGKDKSKT